MSIEAHDRVRTILANAALDRPKPVNQVVGLLYRRLIEDVPSAYELDENLVWSITRNLKRSIIYPTTSRCGTRRSSQR